MGRRIPPLGRVAGRHVECEQGDGHVPGARHQEGRRGELAIDQEGPRGEGQLQGHPHREGARGWHRGQDEQR